MLACETLVCLLSSETVAFRLVRQPNDQINQPINAEAADFYSSDVGAVCFMLNPPRFPRSPLVPYFHLMPQIVAWTGGGGCRADATPFLLLVGVSPGGGHVVIIMHGPSLKTLNPRMPIMPGRSTSDFYRP